MRKKVIPIVAALVVLVIVAGVWFLFGRPMPAFGPWTYVGSRMSDKYHRPSCTWAEHMDPERRVYFSSDEDAQSDGYRACPTCIGSAP